MKARIVVYGSILALLAATVWVVRSQSVWEVASSRSAKADRPALRVPESLIMTGPDRRLLVAYADMDQLLGAPAAGPVEARRAGHGWALVRGEASLDTIADRASFEDLFALLVARARVGGAVREIPDAPPAPSGAPPRTAIHRVHAADRDWVANGPRLATLLDGAAALADLAALAPDRVGVADPCWAAPSPLRRSARPSPPDAPAPTSR